MAADSGAPIVPCVIWGSLRVMTRTVRTPWRQARRTPVVISFGEPLHVGAHDGFNMMTAVRQERMKALLEQAIDHYPDVAEPGAW